MAAVWNRINTVLLLLVLFALLAVIAMLASGVRGGPLDPPSSPASTLPQVEPRKPVPPVGWNGSFPIVLSQPGSYFLTRDLSGVAGQHGIEINASNVTLDLNGWTLTGTATGAGDAITTSIAPFAVNVYNGHIVGWDGDGIDLGLAVGGRISGVHVESVGANGIRLGTLMNLSDCDVRLSGFVGVLMVGDGSVVERCTISVSGSQGIRSDGAETVIRSNYAWKNGTTGVWIRGVRSVVTDNTLQGNGNYGMWVGGAGGDGGGSVVVRNVAIANTTGGYNIFAGDIGPITTAAAATSPWGNINN